MVEVGVGTDDAPQRQDLIEELRQSLTVMDGIACVDENGLFVAHHIQGHQSGIALPDPGVSLYVMQCHECDLLLWGNYWEYTSFFVHLQEKKQENFTKCHYANGEK